MNPNLFMSSFSDHVELSLDGMEPDILWIVDNLLMGLSFEASCHSLLSNVDDHLLQYNSKNSIIFCCYAVGFAELLEQQFDALGVVGGVSGGVEDRACW